MVNVLVFVHLATLANCATPTIRVATSSARTEVQPLPSTASVFARVPHATADPTVNPTTLAATWRVKTAAL
jgi:hypothetical protein